MSCFIKTFRCFAASFFWQCGMLFPWIVLRFGGIPGVYRLGVFDQYEEIYQY
jgi:hypothetical protein